MKRLRTSLRDQTRVSQRRLGCLIPGPSEVHIARLFAVPDTAAVVDVGLKFSDSKDLAAGSHEQTNKNHPNTMHLYQSTFAHEACFDLQDLNLKAGFA